MAGAFMTQCCGSWTVRQGAVHAAILCLVGCIGWLAWQTYVIMYLERIINGDGGPCSPNPCLHGGVCMETDRSNRLSYVCDCLGTGFVGYNCNVSSSMREARRSCAEWYREGHRENKRYMIDPDGPDFHELGPIPIKCEFGEDGRASTVIEHDGMGVHRLAKNYIDDFAASNYIDFTYYYFDHLDNTANYHKYIKAVIDQSQHCEQRFDVKCSKWPLNTATTDTVFLGGITTLNTTKATYLELVDQYPVTPTAGPTAAVVTDAPTGTPAYDTFVNATSYDGQLLDMSGLPFRGTGLGRCSCWLNDDCEETVFTNHKRCNCDVADATNANDSAVFSKKMNTDNLPITLVHLNVPTSSDDVSAFIELTPLRCYDEFEAVDPYSKYPDGGYGKRPARKYTSREREGQNIMWGVIIAFMVITALLLVAAVILLMGAILDSGPTVLFWIVMIILHNIMVFIVLVVRWYFLGFWVVVWELACEFVWMCLSIWALIGVTAFMMMAMAGRH